MDKITRQVRIEHWTQIMNALSAGFAFSLSLRYNKDIR